MIKCLICNKQTKNPKFCSRSCAAINTNKTRRTKLTKKCKDCQTLIPASRKFCDNCSPRKQENITLKEAIYKHLHKSSAYALVRYRARAKAKKLGWNQCKKCGYSKHIEIAHIKPIRDFNEDTPINVINNKSNLIPLCPNCHWEFDHPDS